MTDSYNGRFINFNFQDEDADAHPTLVLTYGRVLQVIV